MSRKRRPPGVVDLAQFRQTRPRPLDELCREFIRAYDRERRRMDSGQRRRVRELERGIRMQEAATPDGVMLKVCAAAAGAEQELPHNHPVALVLASALEDYKRLLGVLEKNGGASP